MEKALFTYAYSTVPAEILTGRDIVTEAQTFTDQYTGIQYLIPGLQPTHIPVYFTLLTSMFMHGSWAHIFGNMLYLFILAIILKTGWAIKIPVVLFAYWHYCFTQPCFSTYFCSKVLLHQA